MTTVKDSLLHSHYGQSHQHPVSLFSRIDTRAVLLSWLLYTILLISVPKYNLRGVVLFGSLPVFVLFASGIPLRPIFKRMAYVSPFILLSAVANPFLDQRPLLAVAGISVTAGMISGAAIVLKALFSVLMVLTLSACMPFDHLCHALRRLRAPEAFTTQLLLLHRYIFVLSDEAASMRRARDLRSFGNRGKGVRTTAGLIGTLLLRSLWRATRVHAAMLSRGFHGTVSCCQANRAFSLTDAFFLTGSAAVFLSIRVFL